jgi:hypothetical protein
VTKICLLRDTSKNVLFISTASVHREQRMKKVKTIAPLAGIRFWGRMRA